MIRLTPLAGLVSLAFITPVFAATPAQPAYMTISAVSKFPWKDGLEITFKTDEGKCSQAYGKKWQNACQAEPGVYGRVVEGISLTPAVPGEWRWISGRTVRFVPETPLVPGRTYNISLDKAKLSSSIKLTKTAASLKIMPLSVQMQNYRFWIDPSEKGENILAATLRLTSRLKDFPQEPTVDAPFQVGEPRFSWNETRDVVEISFPVPSLPEKGGTFNILIPGIQKFWIDSNGFLQTEGLGAKGTSEFSVVLPGKNELYSIKDISIEAESDELKNKVFELEVNPTLYTSPSDLMAKLSVIELPEKLDEKAIEPYNWALAPVLPASALNAGRHLTPISLQKDDEGVSKLKFRIDPKPGRFVLVFVDGSLTTKTGYKLSKQFRKIIKAPSFIPSLQFSQPGHILAASSGKNLELASTGIDEIEWSAIPVKAAYVNILSQFSDSPLTEPLEYLNLSPDSLGDAVKGKISLKGEPEKASYSSVELPLGKNGTGLAFVKAVGLQEGKVKVESPYKLICRTDIGLLAKKSGNGSLDVFAVSFKNGEPEKNAKIRLISKGGNEIAAETTDTSGHVIFKGASIEKEPIAIIAESSDGSDLAWLPLNDSSLAVRPTDTLLNGRQVAANGFTSLVFPQRGIFRPGEELHFGILTRRGDGSVLPPDVPLLATLFLPNGKKVAEKKLKTSAEGVAEFTWPLDVNAPSGDWRLEVTAEGGTVLGSDKAMVGEIQPDTMALKARLAQGLKKGWVFVEKGDPVDLQIQLNGLNGLASAHHKVTGNIEFSAPDLKFDAYPEYEFGKGLENPLLPEGGALKELTTDAQGEASLNLASRLAPLSTAQCSVNLQGFEADGGRAVSNRISFMASNRPFMIGVKGKGAVTNLNFIPQDSQAELELIAVNPDLERTSSGRLQANLYSRRYVTSLTRNAQGKYRYDELPLEKELSSSELEIPESGTLAWKVPTQTPGEYLLSLKDENGELAALIPFRVAGSLPAPNEGLAGAKIRVKTDKASYNAGETIKLAFASPFDGMGLITLERDGVEKATWFKASAGDSVQEIAIPKDFEGKGFVGVSFVRSLDSDQVFLEPEAHAFLPIAVNTEKKRMPIELKAPSAVKPGSILEIEISSPQKGSAIVYGVEEGILQLTNYVTPDPVKALLLDRALNVSTTQTFGQLMPNTQALQKRRAAFGGGEGVSTMNTWFNPFRRKSEPPVSLWKVVQVGPTPTKVSLPIPAYVEGTLRVMAVGAAPEGFNFAQQKTVSAADMAINPNFPLALAPSDKFTGTLTVTNTTGTPIAGALQGRAPGFAPESISQPQQEFKANSEKVVRIAMTAPSEPGVYGIELSMKGLEEPVKRSTSISVRPASSLRTSVQTGFAQGRQTVKPNREVYSFGANMTIEAATVPTPLLKALASLNELYPWDCLEQSLSRAFPSVLLSAHPELLPGGQAERNKFIENARVKIAENMRWDGVSAWPTGSADFFMTLYAADFLQTLREEMGVEDPLLPRLTKIIEREIAQTEADAGQLTLASYGVWILTRTGKVTTQMIQRLEEKRKEAGIAGPGNLSSAFLAASQKIMRMRKPIKFDVPKGGAGYFGENGAYAFYAFLLGRYFGDSKGAQEIGKPLAETLADSLSGNRLSTLDASIGVRALSALYADKGSDDGISLKCVAPENAEGMNALHAPGCTEFVIEGPGEKPYWWQLITTGYDKGQVQSVSNGIAVKRTFLNEKGQPVTNAKLGEILTVKLEVSSKTGEPIKDCVLVEILPGGMEMLMPTQEEVEAGGNAFDRVERREDRIILFGTAPNRPKSFTYRIRAAYEGDFALPPLTAEGMYEPSLNSATSSGRFKVTK